jgi:phosphatidylglycerophosphate synthase
MNSNMTTDTFQKSLKPMAVEEFIDVIFFRRLAHRLVPYLIKVGLTPNQITTISLAWGLGGAYCALQQNFVAAALFIIVAIVFDCCDGQVARLTGQVSPFGRVLDGFFDLLWVAALWLGIFFSGYLEAVGLPTMKWFMYIGGASMVLHCWSFDGVKVKYLEVIEPQFSEKAPTSADGWRQTKEHFRSGHPILALLALIMWFQAYFFIELAQKRQRITLTEIQRRDARTTLDPIIKAWTWLGEGHHNALVVLGLLLTPITPLVLFAAFVIIAVPMNLWWFAVIWRWSRAYKAVCQSK